MKIEPNELMENKKKNKKSNVTTIISVLIVITVLIVIGIIVVMLSMQEKKLSLNIDNSKVDFAQETFLFVESTGQVYVSIKDIAPLVGYDAHNRRI